LYRPPARLGAPPPTDVTNDQDTPLLHLSLHRFHGDGAKLVVSCLTSRPSGTPLGMGLIRSFPPSVRAYRMANFPTTRGLWLHTDKKENINFPIYKEIRNGAVAKSYITNGSLYMGKYFRISSYIGKPLLIYCMTLQLLHSEFPYIWEKKLFYFFISAVLLGMVLLPHWRVASGSLWF
jgi:hypothetical protein